MNVLSEPTNYQEFKTALRDVDSIKKKVNRIEETLDSLAYKLRPAVRNGGANPYERLLYDIIDRLNAVEETVQDLKTGLSSVEQRVGKLEAKPHSRPNSRKVNKKSLKQREESRQSLDHSITVASSDEIREYRHGINAKSETRKRRMKSATTKRRILPRP